ncbi:hypothetical protein ABHN11_12950 [Brevibacillus centrosporus]|uniref:hypothetical protein n=1 Tax=Brevibacillus centrosporus TaxID=54910 RepID=UPI003D23F454
MALTNIPKREIFEESDFNEDDIWEKEPWEQEEREYDPEWEWDPSDDHRGDYWDYC